jgi:hypothetical protein
LRASDGAVQAPSVRASDVAEVSTLRAQVDDLTARLLEVAERYDDTSDSQVATELFAAERALVSARRSLERALALLAPD